MTTPEALLEVWVPSSMGLMLALCLVLALRPLLGRLLGARALLSLWLAVPLSAFAAAIPAVVAPAAAPLPLAAPAPTAAGAVWLVGVEAAAPWLPTLFAFWSVGALALGLVLFQRQRRFGARVVRMTDGRGQRLPAGDSPAVIGLRRPRVVLPLDFEARFSAEEQALILAHEAVHLRRRDNAWNLLATLIWCAQWFNPFAWLAVRVFRDDQDQACDAEVMQAQPGSARAYAAAMLKQAETASAPLASGWVGRHPLVSRVAALPAHRRHSGRWRVVLALALGGAISALAHAAAPRDVDAGTSAQADEAERRLIRLAFAVSANDTVIAQPTLVIREGEAATVSLDGPNGFELKAEARGAGDRIAVVLRLAPAPGGDLVPLGGKDLVVGGAPVTFQDLRVAGKPPMHVSVAADWTTVAELDALRNASTASPTGGSEPLLEFSPTSFPVGLAKPGRALTIVLRVLVSADGTTSEAQVDSTHIESGDFSPYERQRFEAAAISDVRDWRFEPARSPQGTSEPRWVLVPIRYSARIEHVPQG